jgi:hexulose-6-phosphate isomerase
VKTSISVRAIPDDALAEAIAAAGFDGIEAPLGAEGALTHETSESTCRELAAGLHRCGLRISAVSSCHPLAANVAPLRQGSEPPADAGAIAVLDRATWLGADAVVFTNADAPETLAASPPGRYEASCSLMQEALLRLRFEAEARGVHIGLSNRANRCFSSPLETRRLIDQVNSPWVGVWLDCSALPARDNPTDWLNLLGHRVDGVYVDACVELPGEDVHSLPAGVRRVDWSVVFEAVQQMRYDGHVVYRGAETPRDAMDALCRCAPALRPPGDSAGAASGAGE